MHVHASAEVSLGGGTKKTIAKNVETYYDAAMIIMDIPISLEEIQKNHSHFYQSLVKAVVDIEQETIGLDGEMHADIMNEMLFRGSNQENLWGIKIIFENPYQIQYISLINIRPAMGNKKMEIESQELRDKISAIVHKLVVQ